MCCELPNGGRVIYCELLWADRWDQAHGRDSSLRPGVVERLPRAHPFLAENERMDRDDSVGTVDFAGVFARFRLHLNTERLYRVDEKSGEVPVRLGKPGFLMLRELLKQDGDAVSNQALKDAAWGEN